MLNGAGVGDAGLSVYPAGLLPRLETPEAPVQQGADIVQLICEGGCNPNLPEIDAWTAQERAIKEDMRDGPMLPVDGAIVPALRRLQHTAHVRSNRPGRYICTVCGWARKYGE